MHFPQVPAKIFPTARIKDIYISRQSQTTRNVLWSRSSVSVRGRMPKLLHGPGSNLGSGRGYP